MSDILIRKDGKAGRITLNRPDVLNALTWPMCSEIYRALGEWANDPDIALLVVDGAGDRAFSAGGDIAEMYARGCAKDYDYMRRFWRDEYRMNARMFNFSKPVVTFLHGFTMGGGVGVGCHGSHRIVCETSRIAMPEVSIGLCPDVGGSLILARAPGRIGEYLGVTASRMDTGDAIHAGFADYFVPQAEWPELIVSLCATGNWQAVDSAALPPPTSALADSQPVIDRVFDGERLEDCLTNLDHENGAFAEDTRKALSRNAPLGMACAIEQIHRVRARDTIEAALDQEYRFTWRSGPQGDFFEGIRAAIIDKDRNPRWAHAHPSDVKAHEVSAMLQPLGPDKLAFQEY